MAALMALAILGGALGGMARVLVGWGVALILRGPWPWGTFTVNLSGSAAAGALIGLAPPGPALVFLGIGFLGAYTTVSSFALEAVVLASARRRAIAAAYVLVSGIGCIAAALAGHALVRALGA